MSSQFIQCIAITNNNTRCTRKAVINNYCLQHYNMRTKSKSVYEELENNQQEMIPDLMTNIVSDYIEYEELQELQNEIPNLKINPNRIKITTRFAFDKLYNQKTRL